MRHRNLWDAPEPEVYAAGLDPYVLIVRGATGAQALAPVIRATVNEVDRNQPVADSGDIGERVDPVLFSDPMAAKKALGMSGAAIGNS